MLPESIEELQSRVFREVLGFEEIPFMGSAFGTEISGSSSLFVDPHLLNPANARKASRPRRIEEDVALGMGPGASEGDAKLAVLVQNQRFLHSGAIDRIRDIAKGEVEVLYIGRQQPLWKRSKQRPLRMGASVSPDGAGYAGTLGFIAKSRKTGRDGIVSNNHVLADVNSVPIGADVIQPAGGDEGSGPEDIVGKLANFIPILFGGATNVVDAAFAELAAGVTYDARTIWDNGDPPSPAGTLTPDATVSVLPGLDVIKTGRTTGHTTGVVRAINVNNYTVDMGRLGMARFDGQIIFETRRGASTPFSKPGDSGSLIVDSSGAPVALLFAGSQSGGNGNLGITGGNPISSVLSQLDIALV